MLEVLWKPGFLFDARSLEPTVNKGEKCCQTKISDAAEKISYLKREMKSGVARLSIENNGIIWLNKAGVLLHRSFVGTSMCDHVEVERAETATELLYCLMSHQFLQSENRAAPSSHKCLPYRNIESLLFNTQMI